MTTVNLPNIKCYITPPNKSRVDYSKYFVYNGSGGSASFSQSFGRQGSTGTVYLADPNYSSTAYTGNKSQTSLTVSPSFVIPAYSQILIVDQSIASLPNASSFNNGVLFSGYVSNPTLTFDSANTAIWSLAVIDYSGYMNASVVSGQYDGLPMDDLIVLLVNQANCGVKAATVRNGGYISPGPVMPRLVFPHCSLTEALQKISKFASNTSAFGWYVDQNLNLHFYDQNQASSSGITVTDSPTSTSRLSYTEAHMQMNNTKYEFDGTSLYNRAIVTGVTTTIHPKKKAAPTDTFVAGANQFAFNLSNIPDPASTNPIVTVNNTKQSCLYSDGTGTQTTAFGPPQWLVQQQANGSWALRVNFPDASPPSGGSIINIWYPYQTSVTAQADDTQSQIAIGGPNKGIFAKGINARTLSDTSAAQQRAKREVKEYGRPQERITFTTTEEWVGLWQAGQSFTLKSSMLLDSQNNFTAPLNATFVITQASPNFTQDGFRTWNITGVRVQ